MKVLIVMVKDTAQIGETSVVVEPALLHLQLPHPICKCHIRCYSGRFTFRNCRTGISTPIFHSAIPKTSRANTISDLPNADEPRRLPNRRRQFPFPV